MKSNFLRKLKTITENNISEQEMPVILSVIYLIKVQPQDISFIKFNS